jgi:hypothetical protein
VSLRRLLRIRDDYLTEQQQKAMRFAELAWVKSGSPIERKSLIAFLENTIVRCVEEGVEYPPILLKRKKELERHEWTPTAESTPVPTFLHHPKIPDEWIRQAEEAHFRRQRK